MGARKDAQLLRSGSTIKVMVYHRYAWKVLVTLLTCGKGKFWCLSKLVAEHSEARTGCPVTYIYFRKQARKLLEGAGFRVTEVTVDHIFPYRVSSYTQYRYDKAWFFRWLPGAVFRWLERHFGWHLLVTAEAP